MMAVDAVDRQLIRLLQEHPRASYAEIARLVDISESTVRRRIEQLYASGVISATVLADVWQLGYRAICLIGIKADLNHVEEIAAHLRDCDAVTMVLVTLGGFDLFIAVAMANVEDIYPFLREHIAPLPGVRDVETFVSTSSVKLFRDWRVPPDATERSR
ncbi:MAG: Lrp/AsnC family transcriptional regulator [Chloroflexota bacterium]|nr:Lrp/AsnC family transcriptional regulator [Chloroflexota bacterium]